MLLTLTLVPPQACGQYLTLTLTQTLSLQQKQTKNKQVSKQPISAKIKKSPPPTTKKDEVYDSDFEPRRRKPPQKKKQNNQNVLLIVLILISLVTFYPGIVDYTVNQFDSKEINSVDPETTWTRDKIKVHSSTKNKRCKSMNSCCNLILPL